MEPLGHDHLQRMSDHDLLIRLTVQMDNTCTNIDDLIEAQKDLSKRVSVNEEWRLRLVGAVAILMVVLGLFAQYVIPRLP